MYAVHVYHVLFVFALFLATPVDALNKVYKVNVNTKECVHKTDEKFLSIALDSSLIRYRWQNFDFASKKLFNLAQSLTPAYLRVGGTDEDFLLFKPDEEYTTNTNLSQKVTKHSYTLSPDQLTHPFTNFTMTTKDVNNLLTFAKESGLSVIFGLNLLLRDSETHTWNSTNAVQLMKYIFKRGFTCGWELGNEPFDLHRIINHTITAKKLAADFNIFRKLLDDHPEYGRIIVGPDVSSPWFPPMRNKYLGEFLRNIDEGCIDALTYHQYYTNNQANVSEFYNPDILDDLITEMQQVERIMKESGASLIQPWLGETSSAYGMGVPGVSDSYIAGFMWLDKLGVAARLKHNIVIRQTFYGGSYSMLNLVTLDPFPDYWSAFLHKKLVGSRVLEVHDGISLGRTLRVYAHCTSERSGYETGSIVLIVLNTLHNDVQVILTNGLENLLVHQYLLTPGEKNKVTSQNVRLNGKLLQMVNDTFLPSVQPKPITPSDNIILPAVTYGFYVIPDARATACLTSRDEFIPAEFVKN